MTLHTRHLAVVILASFSLIFLVSAAAAAAAFPAGGPPALDAAYRVAVNAGGDSYTDPRHRLPADKPYSPGVGLCHGPALQHHHAHRATRRPAALPDRALEHGRLSLRCAQWRCMTSSCTSPRSTPTPAPAAVSSMSRSRGETVIEDLDIFATVGAFTPLVRRSPSRSAMAAWTSSSPPPTRRPR